MRQNVAGYWKQTYTYDGRQRVRVRSDYTWINGWYPNGEVRYLYDGMEIVQERTSSNNPTVTYTRGVDLSGSLGGAGGIGGLLARSAHSSTTPYQLSTTANYHADGNGNITALADSTGSLVANYRYDPYGRTLASSGGSASANLMRFSSKPLWAANVGSSSGGGLYYYGYRVYDPTEARWVNRDPIEEEGGLNLYAYVGNEPDNDLDPLGLQLSGAGTLAADPTLVMGEEAAAAYRAAKAAREAKKLADACKALEKAKKAPDAAKKMLQQVQKNRDALDKLKTIKEAQEKVGRGAIRSIKKAEQNVDKLLRDIKNDPRIADELGI